MAEQLVVKLPLALEVVVLVSLEEEVYFERLLRRVEYSLSAGPNLLSILLLGFRFAVFFFSMRAFSGA